MTVPLPSAGVATSAPAVLEQLPAAARLPGVAEAPPRRLAGLDGVRGLAALFVVVNHVFLRAFPGYPVDKAPFWAAWFIYGRFAVVVFIVLSGFSLALSPACHGWRLDGVSQFARRRAWRILPPYWAALGFSLAVAWLLVRPPGQGVPGTSSVIVNGLLVQNLVAAPSPNRAFWSIAVEAQLYVLFPLLLLIVRRRGAIVMAAAVTLVVAMVGIVGPHVSYLDVFVIQSAPDLAALFAVGILAAGIVGASGAHRSWPWASLALAAAAPCARDDLVAGLGLVVAGHISQGAPPFLVSLALVLPLTIVFARAFAAVFETPFRRHRMGVGARRPDRSVVLEPRREGVAQQHHVADLADVGELRPLAGIPGEMAVAHESGSL